MLPTKIALTQIDTTQPFNVKMSIEDYAIDNQSTIIPCAELILSSNECHDLINGWLLHNKKWRGTFNKALTKHTETIKASFNYSIVIQMLGCHGYPCDDNASNLIVKILNWKTSFIPLHETPSIWVKNLINSGKDCIFELEFLRK